MNQKTYTNLPPNFLASEIGLITKTFQIAQSGVDPNAEGRKIVKGGTVYPSNDTHAKGIVFEDVDVTDGDKPGALIVAGRIFENRLATQSVASAAKTALNASGIVLVDADGMERE